MPVHSRPGILGIFLRPSPDRELRIGSLVRDATGAVVFDVDEAYVNLGPARPIVSLAWRGKTEQDSVDRLRNKYDKMARGQSLPAYFDNLLPEGALLDLVEKEFGTGDFDRYDVLARLGADLPGAIVARREAGVAPPEASATNVDAGRAGPIGFSLAGVQLKFSMRDDRRRLTAPGVDEGGDLILKLPTQGFPGLVENEYTAMKLAGLAGVNVSTVRLVESATIDGVPKAFLKAGKFSLAVSRFDRASGGVRIHTEDFAQLFGAVADQKYFLANQESMIRAVRRFSKDPIGATIEGFRRLVVDIMVGNGDGHMKNWSFIFPDGRHAGPSPAYDIVSTLTYTPDRMALKLYGTKNPRIVKLSRLRKMAKLVNVDEDMIEREVRNTVTKILDTWPSALKDLPASDNVKQAILSRFDELALVQEIRPKMVQGSD
jgi:serine/threonine-protein kinase HipA